MADEIIKINQKEPEKPQKRKKMIRGVIGLSLVGAGIYGLTKLLGMKNISEKVVTNLVNPRIHKIDGTGLYFRTEIEINNPTKSSMKITKPVVYLTTKESPLTTSQSEDKTFEIKALQKTNIDTIELHLTWTQLLPFGLSIVKNFSKILSAMKNGSTSELSTALGIPLEMKYSLYANGIFYESKPEKII